MAFTPEDTFAKEGTVPSTVRPVTPPVEAIENGVAAAFPDLDSDVACIAALAFPLNWKILELPPTQRTAAVNLVNTILARTLAHDRPLC